MICVEQILQSLHTRAETALQKWNSDSDFRDQLPAWSKTTKISFECGDLSTAGPALESVHVGFANSTLFDPQLMQALARVAGNMRVDSLFVTFSKDIPCSTWKVLERYQAMMSWGVCVVIIQQKVAEGYSPAGADSGKFYSNRDDHTYAPEGDEGAFLTSIVARASGRGQAKAIEDDVLVATAKQERELREVLAAVWASNSTQIKVLQKLKRVGLGSIETLRQKLGHVAGVETKVSSEERSVYAFAGAVVLIWSLRCCVLAGRQGQHRRERCA